MSGKICSSYIRRRYIFLIMILPDKIIRSNTWRCNSDVGRVLNCHLYVSKSICQWKIKKSEKHRIISFVFHLQITRLHEDEGEKMSEKITKEQINVTMALALMKYLYNQGKISEKVYKKILDKYSKKSLAN